MIGNQQPVYITEEGIKKFKDELAILKTKLHEIANRIDQAKELGDLSENAEYHEAKDDYAFTQGRILELENAVTRAVVIQNRGTDAVNIGSAVKIKDNRGKEFNYKIVGSNEASPLKGLISNESPLAQAFLGRKKGDRVEVKTPNGLTIYTILDIS